MVGSAKPVSSRAGILFLVAFQMTVAAGPVCTDADGDGFSTGPGCPTADCNDANADIHPLAYEACNGFDDDCDGLIDNHPSCSTTCTTPHQDLDDLITSLDAPPSTPTTVWTGDGFAVAWSEAAANAERIAFQRLDLAGDPAGPVTLVAQHLGKARGPSLVWTGAEFGITWWDDSPGNREVFFARLDAQGAPIGASTRITEDPGSSRWPMIAWNGSGFGVVWFDDRSGDSEIYFTQLDAQGSRIEDDVRLTFSGEAFFPRLVWSGDSYGVAYNHGSISAKQFMRIDPAGSALVVPVTVGPGQVTDIAWTGSHYGIVGPEGPPGSALVFSSVDAAGIPDTADQALSTNAAASALPALAWTGAEYGAAWIDRVDTVDVLTFARLDPAGTRIGPALAVNDRSTEPLQPRLIWSGASFGLAWLARQGGDRQVHFDFVYCECLDREGDGLDSCEDCDDTAPTGPTELVCDGFDNDCDPATTDTPDADGDGLACDDDCDDTDPEVGTGLPELGCDGRDNDCDPVTSDILDADGDGFNCDIECDDGLATVYPGAPQICDRLNNDCDDPSWPTPLPDDDDGDGDGFYECEDDCDDTDPATNPMAPEIDCDGRDNDCSGLTPDVFDVDGDGFDCDTDCDEDDPAVSPAAVEVPCDGVDNDCNAATPEGIDADGDSSPCLVDCDESDRTVYPGAPELCDGQDNDCDGLAEPRAGPPALLASVPAHPSPAVAPAADGFAMIHWNRVGGSNPIIVSRFAHDGALLGAVEIPTSSNVFYPPAIVAGADGGWTALWAEVDQHTDTSRLEIAAISEDGQTVERQASFDEGSGSPSSMSLVWNGSVYAVTWNVLIPWEVNFLLLDADFATLAGPISLHQGGGLDRRSPSVAWNGSEFGVAYGNRFNVRFQRASATGVPIGAPITLASASQDGLRGLDMLWTGTEYAITWAAEVGNDYQIFFARLTSGSCSQTPFCPIVRQVTSAGGDSEDPRLVWNGSEFGLTWNNRSSGQVYLGRLDASGNDIVDTVPVTVRPPAPYASQPAIYTGDGEYGIAYYSAILGLDDIWLERVFCNCGDGDGGVCDIDGGSIDVEFVDPSSLQWQDEAGWSSWNLYRGALSVLLDGGDYSQPTFSHPLANSHCAIASPGFAAPVVPDPGETAFYLVTGAAQGTEGELGVTSDGTVRPHTNPCP